MITVSGWLESIRAKSTENQIFATEPFDKLMKQGLHSCVIEDMSKINPQQSTSNGISLGSYVRIPVETSAQSTDEPVFRIGKLIGTGTLDVANYDMIPDCRTSSGEFGNVLLPSRELVYVSTSNMIKVDFKGHGGDVFKEGDRVHFITEGDCVTNIDAVYVSRPDSCDFHIVRKLDGEQIQVPAGKLRRGFYNQTVAKVLFSEAMKRVAREGNDLTETEATELLEGLHEYLKERSSTEDPIAPMKQSIEIIESFTDESFDQEILDDSFSESVDGVAVKPNNLQERKNLKLVLSKAAEALLMGL